MTVTRRHVMLSGGAATVLTACGGGGGPATLNVRAQGVVGMNPGPDGGDRPLVLQVVQMSGTGAFDAADFFALQTPDVALGSEFISVQQIPLSPGAAQSVDIEIADTTRAIGIVAGFRNPEGRIFRLKTEPPGRYGRVIVNVGSGGLSLTEV